jgi:alanyl-tRNA synthetase
MSEKWTAKKCRETFVEFFEGKDHLFVPSSGCVPLSDPTILFANAGMNQFKPIFLGQVRRNTDPWVGSSALHVFLPCPP